MTSCTWTLVVDKQTEKRMKNENDEERRKNCWPLQDPEQPCLDYMGKITDACDSVVVLLAEL